MSHGERQGPPSGRRRLPPLQIHIRPQRRLPGAGAGADLEHGPQRVLPHLQRRAAHRDMHVRDVVKPPIREHRAASVALRARRVARAATQMQVQRQQFGTRVTRQRQRSAVHRPEETPQQRLGFGCRRVVRQVGVVRDNAKPRQRPNRGRVVRHVEQQRAVVGAAAAAADVFGRQHCVNHVTRRTRHERATGR